MNHQIECRARMGVFATDPQHCRRRPFSPTPSALRRCMGTCVCVLRAVKLFYFSIFQFARFLRSVPKTPPNKPKTVPTGRRVPGAKSLGDPFGFVWALFGLCFSLVHKISLACSPGWARTVVVRRKPSKTLPYGKLELSLLVECFVFFVVVACFSLLFYRPTNSRVLYFIPIFCFVRAYLLLSSFRAQCLFCCSNQSVH